MVPDFTDDFDIDEEGVNAFDYLTERGFSPEASTKICLHAFLTRGYLSPVEIHKAAEEIGFYVPPNVVIMSAGSSYKH